MSASLKDFNLFFAVGSKQYLEFLLVCNVKNILISYAYPDPWHMKGLLHRNHVNILCDSGAFTAWNLSQKARRRQAEDLFFNRKFAKELITDDDEIERLKAEFHKEPDAYKKSIYEEIDRVGKWRKHLINIDGYLDHLNKHKDIIFRAVNLDVIPGEQGSKPTDEQVIQAAEEGWNNYQYLKKKGWDTVHVFHQGEPLWVLNRMLDECDYIGVSPCNDSSEKSKFEWMDTTFRHIMEYDYSKNPRIQRGEIIKTHGFAVTSPILVKRYPWFSVDSSSYSLTASMGSILTPYGRIYVSEKDLGQKNHIVNKPEEIRKHIEDYTYKQIGYGISSMSEAMEEKELTCARCQTTLPITEKVRCYKPRNFMNITYFQDLQQERRAKGPTLDFMKQQCLF